MPRKARISLRFDRLFVPPVERRPAAASDASRVEWVAEQNLRQYRLTEGTLGVIERAFAKLQR